MFKKIWSDSVGSKIIASAIIGLFLIIYTKIESVSKEISFNESLKKILYIKLSVVYVIGFLLLLLILKSIFQKMFFSTSKETKKQKRLREFNKSLDKELGLMYKWRVYFKQGGMPSIIDFTGFCTKHGDAPLKLVNGNCPIRDCSNHRINLNEYLTENYIESLVIHEWELINGK